MSQKLKAILAELRRRLEELYGDRMVRMVLYGSQARGEAVEGSDIDVLVVLAGPVNPGEEVSRTGEVAADLSLQNNVVVSCAFVTELRYDTERSPFLINVRREGMPV